MKVAFNMQRSNNFGRRKNNPAKDRKALETYVSLRGYKQGGNGSNQYVQKDHNGLFAKSTLDEIAKELNMSTTNLKRALRIERNLTDSMKELLDTGVITKTLPYKTFASDTFASDTIATLSGSKIPPIIKLFISPKPSTVYSTFPIV